MPMQNFPTGTVTFLFTDVEGSTQLWERYPEEMRAALARHDRLIEEIMTRHGGNLVRPRGEGDSRFAVFSRATEAVAAAAAMQKALHAEPWPTPAPLCVRAALHTGEADLREGDYYGSAVNRCARLRSAAHGGQTLVGAATQELVRDVLPEGVTLRDLGEHLLRDLQQPERIFQLVIPGLPSDFPPIITLDAQPNNLPTQRTPLVGREAEVAAVQRLLLREEVGLLTLTGPGGIGKTRLGLQVAAEVADHFPDGVYFVSLASITDPDQVAPAIAQTLGVKEVVSLQVGDALVDYLSERRLLLLLDNFEQVIAAAPTITKVLAAAPRLKVLVTSREVLHLRDEQEFSVPPLGVPDLKRLPLTSKGLPSLERLSQYESVALFIQRARLVKPDFEVTNENAPAVAEICYRLDGLPLAIELAAARIRLLPPDALLGRLASRLRLLTAGARDLPERQQTLRSTIQWSYDLLQPGEQKLFRCMSVFVGGSTLEAIEAVCNPDGSLDLDLLDGVASLVDKSLLRQETGVSGVSSGFPQQRGREREPRIGMLETIREFATELLQSAEPQQGEEQYRQHAKYYMALAEQAREGVQGPDQGVWLDRLDAEHDNLQSAIKWAIEHGDAETALRLGGALWVFRGFRIYPKEGLQWLREALSMPGAAARNRARAVALMAAALMSGLRNDPASARLYTEESISVFRELGPKESNELGLALLIYGNLLASSGEKEATRAAVEEGTSLLRQTGSKWDLSYGAFVRGFAASTEGDLAAAAGAFEESIALCREVGNKWILSNVLNSLGDISRVTGNYARAREAYEESLALMRELNARTDIPASVHNLGHVALAQGELDEAKRLFVEALRLQINYKDRVGIAECLAGLAGVAGAEKRPERAARLFGATAAIREAHSVTVWPAEQVDYERNLRNARAQLDDATWARAWQEGRAISMEQAIAYALNDREEAETPPTDQSS